MLYVVIAAFMVFPEMTRNHQKKDYIKFSSSSGVYYSYKKKKIGASKRHTVVYISYSLHPVPLISRIDSPLA